ncbi:MAG: arylsulfatase, partial [Saprospiraceae bacterium]|nr:arylsulfatase [Saprospiraceae bacterium]
KFIFLFISEFGCPMQKIIHTLFFYLICIITVYTQSNGNVLLILVDDLGYGDLSMAANPYLKTPHLDSLSGKSVRFTNFYVSPVCAPTRASLLTGMYHQKVGVQNVTNGFEMLDPNALTMAEILRKVGYKTALFGKWHLGEYYPSTPNAQGFDYYLGFKTGHTADYYHPMLEENETVHRFPGYITDILTDNALDFIASAGAEPFFCYLAYNAPHTPLQIDSSYVTPFLAAGLDERTARVYGMVKNLDDNIGKLLSGLTELGKASNTLVIFMSDNGPISGWQVPQSEMRYNAGLRDQKFTIYEGGTRTQCFWYWPGKIEGKVVEDVAAHIDVLPTILDLLEWPDHHKLGMDGRSLLPSIEGRHKDHYYFQRYDLQSVGSTDPYPGGIARKGDWKLVDGKALYNLRADIGESRDVHAQYPRRYKKMRRAYEHWWQEIVSESDLMKRPIPVGFREAPKVYLQPHHALATGHLKFAGRRGLLGEKIGFHPSGVDGDWVVGWQTVADQLTWDIYIQEDSWFDMGIIGEQWEKLPKKVNILIDAKSVGALEMIHDTQDILGKNRVFLEKGSHKVSVKIIDTLSNADIILNALLIKKVD